MAFIGLIPSEHANGAKVKKGPVLDNLSDFRRSILDRERKCCLA